jgi:hypothetical protein
MADINIFIVQPENRISLQHYFCNPHTTSNIIPLHHLVDEKKLNWNSTEDTITFEAAYMRGI